MINGTDLGKVSVRNQEVERKRICDLKRGDEFIFYGREKRVTSVDKVVRFVDEHNYPNKLSAKSQQWVELVSKHDQIRARFYRGEPVSKSSDLPASGVTLRAMNKRAAGIFIEKKGRENGYSF